MNKQDMKVLAYLRSHEGMTTKDACDNYILSPTKRVQELRDAGFNIETVRKNSKAGRKFGMYVLHEEGGENDAEIEAY